MSTYLIGRAAPEPPVRRIRDGDRNAWNSLVAREHPRLFNLHWRLCGDREAAADMTQETFRAAFESCSSFQGRGSAATWLYGVALNVNRSWRRRQGRHEAPDLADEGLPDPDPTPEQLALMQEQSERVYGAVAALPETYREVVALRYFAGVPAVEIARVAGVPAETVRWRLHRAMQLLWATLQPQLGKENCDDTAAN